MRFWKKKEQRPYPRSFAKRLTLHIMLRMLILMSIPTALVFWLGYSMSYMGAALLSDRILKGEYEEIRRINSDLYVAAQNTGPIIEDNLSRPDKMPVIIERLLKLNPYIRSCGISFRENYYPQKGRLYSPHAIRRDSTTIDTQPLERLDYDYLKAEWFQEAISQREGFWSNAYLDSADHGMPMVSYLLPIRDHLDSTVAVLSVDLSLDWLADKIQLQRARQWEAHADSADGSKKWDAKLQFYYMMVDTTGTLLVHPDKQRIIHQRLQQYMDTSQKVTVESILNLCDDAESDATVEGQNVYITYRPVKYTHWALIIVVPTFFIDLVGYLLGGLFIFFIIIGLLTVYFFGRRAIRRVARPLNQLATSAEEVAKGHFDTPLPVMKSRDEIQQLRDSFENMQHSLTRYMDELRATTAQKASMESELKIAHDIQMSMLPKTFPPFPERDDIDIYGSLTPAKAVGGDLFDFFIRDSRLYFCIGDVSGKGVPASLFMAVTRSLFRNVSAHISEPRHIVEAINATVSDGNDTNMFITLFVGVLDLTTGQLQYSNAAHNEPLLLGDSVSHLACHPNVPAGVMKEWQFSQQETTLAPETTIFLFTDGLNEAEDATQAQFGDQRILDVATTVLASREHQPTILIRRMTDAVRAFVGGAEQSDDLTMLSIQFRGKK